MPVGITQYVAVETVVAIHANAHYTTIFNGQESCSARSRSATSKHGSTPPLHSACTAATS